MPLSNAALAQNFFAALVSKNFNALPLAADIVMESPISPRLSGLESVLEFLEGLASVTKEVRLLDSFGEGNKLAVEFELKTAEGVIAGFECFEIVDGQIKRMRPYFDARPLLGSAT